jgi:pyruvate dehydrogenase complex dehydrogenase (E1) component
MMDHRSSKVCAAAGPACKHSHAGTVAIATILKGRRMIASQMNDQMKQLKVMKLRSPQEEFPRLKK